MEIVDAKFCQCGDPSVMWTDNGEGFCNECRWEYHERQLEEGKPIRFMRGDDTDFVAFPLTRTGFLVSAALLEVTPDMIFSGPGMVRRMVDHVIAVRARDG